MRIAAAIAACVFALAPVAFAEDAVPEVLMAPTLSAVPGRQIDIRGISPGMGLEEVRALLMEMFGDEPFDWPRQTTLTQSGVTVVGTPFISSLKGSDETEELKVTFSGVSSGNQVVLVQREGKYRIPGEAPVFRDFVASLVGKYGPPSGMTEGREAADLVWLFKGGSLVQCYPSKAPYCVYPDTAVFEPARYAADFDVMIRATVKKSSSPDRVHSYKQSSTDLALKTETDAADTAGLESALAEAVAASLAEAPAPAL